MPDHYSLLLDWRRSEGSTRGLAKLPHDFIPATQAYLADARRVYESELRENPSGKKGEVARQTYQRAAQIARDIVEARMTKVLSQSFQASVGGSRELANSLPDERRLFEGLVEALRAHRQSVAPYLEPMGPPTLAPAKLGTPERPEPSPPAESPPRKSGPPQVLVRIVKDGRPIEVGGETIDLRKEDVISLPAETARILIEGKVAEKVERTESPAVA
jgi:DNA replication initiation complex subunit (GINS family)